MDMEHRQAIAGSQRQTHAVRNYLELLTGGPNRVTLHTSLVGVSDVARELRLSELLPQIEMARLLHNDPLELLELHSEKARLEAMSVWETNLADAEAAFIEHAAGYAQRKKVPFDAWLEMGVPIHVLEAAGLAA